jgi:hypothetical protein
MMPLKRNPAWGTAPGTASNCRRSRNLSCSVVGLAELITARKLWPSHHPVSRTFTRVRHIVAFLSTCAPEELLPEATDLIKGLPTATSGVPRSPWVSASIRYTPGANATASRLWKLPVHGLAVDSKAEVDLGILAPFLQWLLVVVLLRRAVGLDRGRYAYLPPACQECETPRLPRPTTKSHPAIDGNRCEGDLVDLAAANTLLRAGSIHALDRRDGPGQAAIAATVRHPLEAGTPA